jgi:hypothetical protein
MANLKNLFKSRQIRLYDVKRQAVDDRKNEGNKYRENVLRNSISPYIYRNPQMNDFVIMVQHVLADLIDSVAFLKKYKSYTTRKDDTRTK